MAVGKQTELWVSWLTFKGRESAFHSMLCRVPKKSDGMYAKFSETELETVASMASGHAG